MTLKYNVYSTQTHITVVPIFFFFANFLNQIYDQSLFLQTRETGPFSLYAKGMFVFLSNSVLLFTSPFFSIEFAATHGKLTSYGPGL